ncbi:MAG: hypothetical protein CML46_09285 [Rhodobacteraceae bacterium]|nr:hypothetical protein [Paracoccaceae bacterium]MBR27117.1 hypothetical protein [Paracoccaceae bacterium]
MPNKRRRTTAHDVDQEAREDAVFKTLDELYQLPPEDAINSAGLVAGQIAAFLADVAQLSSNDQTVRAARVALVELSCDCGELVGEIQRARAGALVEGKRRGDGAGGQVSGGETPEPSGHNIALFKPRSSHRAPRVTRT